MYPPLNTINQVDSRLFGVDDGNYLERVVYTLRLPQFKVRALGLFLYYINYLVYMV